MLPPTTVSKGRGGFGFGEVVPPPLWFFHFFMFFAVFSSFFNFFILSFFVSFFFFIFLFFFIFHFWAFFVFFGFLLKIFLWFFSIPLFSKKIGFLHIVDLIFKCLDFFDFFSFPPLHRTPPPRDPIPLDRPKLRVFFFDPSPAPIFRFFFSSLGVFSWNFGGVWSAGTLKCARLEFSGCRVKPRRPRPLGP